MVVGIVVVVVVDGWVVVEVDDELVESVAGTVDAVVVTSLLAVQAVKSNTTENAAKHPDIHLGRDSGATRNTPGS